MSSEFNAVTVSARMRNQRFESTTSPSLPSIRWQRHVVTPGAKAETTPIAAIMNRRVVTVTSTMSLENLLAVLFERDIRAVPVVDAQGRLVGMVCKSDLVRELDELAATLAEGAGLDHAGGRARSTDGHLVDPLAALTVRQVMTPLVCALSLEASVAEAAALLARRNVWQVPVVTPGGRVAGLVTSREVLRWLGAVRVQNG